MARLMGDKGDKSHEELLKEPGMSALGKTQMAHDSYTSMERMGHVLCGPSRSGSTISICSLSEEQLKHRSGNCQQEYWGRESCM